VSASCSACWPDYDFGNLKGTIQDQGVFFAGEIKQKSAWAIGGGPGGL
jgi:hypothetical protein